VQLVCQLDAAIQQLLVESLIILIMIYCPLGLCAELQQLLLPPSDLPPQSPLSQRQSGLPLRIGFGFDEIGKTFRLGQIDTAIFECATCKFSRRSKAQAFHLGQASQRRIHYRSTTMTLKFNNVFSGRTYRSVESENQRLIQHFTRIRIPKLPDRDCARPGQSPANKSCSFMCLRPTDPDDRNCCRWPAARKGKNGV
jgi:hypothetical protein